jgi:hypothetical protein
LSLNSNVVNASNGTTCNGQASVTPTGGTLPYTFNWSPGGGTNDTIIGKCANQYCCVVTDHNGCKDSTCVIINVTGIETISNSSDINIYPDPNTGYFTVDGVMQGEVIELYNYLGQKVSRIVADNTTMHFNIATEPNGVYLIRILDKEGSLVAEKKMIKAR